MCARITLTTTREEMTDLFGLGYDLEVQPRFNMAPSQPIPVLRNTLRGGREFVMMRWGLIPYWNTDPKHPGFVNARAETASNKPAFRDAFRYRRALVPASGFYEWQHQGRHKQPYHFRRVGGRAFAFAAIWDRWITPGGGIDTVAILTTQANEVIGQLHERMPAILSPDRFGSWLNPRENCPDSLLTLLQSDIAETLEFWPVSSRVNSPNVDEPTLNIPVQTRQTTEQPTLFDVA